MVGLSIVLEGEKSVASSSKKVSDKKSNIIVNKTNMIIINNKSCSSYSCSYFHAQTQTPSFLDHCFLCTQKLLPGKDIYMYRGDRAFCSVECRCRQIFMDEEESKTNHVKNCSLMASSSSSSSSSRHRRGAKNRAL